jgi:Fe-S cluster assembly iron-binding protein IscA
VVTFSVKVIAMENNKVIINPNESHMMVLAIRVSMIEEEGAAPFLGLSLDEEKPQDESFCIQGVTFIMDKILLEQCGAINIDFIEGESRSGLKITSANSLLSGYDC